MTEPWARPVLLTGLATQTVLADPDMADSRLGEQVQGGIVLHLAGRVDQAAMAVAGVFAQADVGDDEQFRIGLLEAGHGLLHDAVGGVGPAADRVFFLRQPEKHDRAQSLVHGHLSQVPTSIQVSP